jgi:UDP-3-O-[3-hydroxymyristoyl] glucosamine N-acyltransferase
MTHRLTDIAQFLNADFTGVESATVTGLSSIEAINANTIVLVKDKASLSIAEDSLAAAIVVPLHLASEKKPFIKVDKPELAFIQLLQFFSPKKQQEASIHPSAIIENDVELGQNLSIGPYVTIGKGTKIGDNTIIKAHTAIGDNVTIGCGAVIHPHVVIYDNSVLKDSVIIHASSVIGSDGFGYEFDGETHQKLPHIGQVVIGKNVEIGSNSVIDRGTIGKTEIGQGTKIDNLVQIAHNVKIGEHAILCAFTGVAGSTTLGNHVVCAANVGISDHAQIEDNVVLGPRAGVAAKKRCPKGSVWLGSPARPIKQSLEQTTLLHRLPSMRKTLQALLKRVARLEKEETLE